MTRHIRLNQAKAWGSAPAPRQGALPPGPPPEAAASGLRSFWLGCGRGVRGSGWAVGVASAIAGATPTAQPDPRTPLPHPNQTRGFQGPLPLAGIQGAEPLGGVQGRSPRPSPAPTE